MGIDDIEQIQSGRDDDAQVPVTAVVFPHFGQIVERVPAVEFVRSSGGLYVIGELEPLIAPVVEVDDEPHRRQSPEHDRQLPVAAVVELAGSRTYSRERRSFFHAVDRPLIVQRGIADEVDIGGDRAYPQQCAPRVVADHFALYRIDVFLRRIVPSQRVVLALVVAELAVFSEAEVGCRGDGPVQNRYLPCLFVIQLAEAGGDRRYPAYARNRHRVPEKLAVPNARRVACHASQLTALSGGRRRVELDGRQALLGYGYRVGFCGRCAVGYDDPGTNSVDDFVAFLRGLGSGVSPH